MYWNITVMILFVLSAASQTEPSKGCHDNAINLHGSEGDLQNPNYPSPSHGNEDITWVITAPPGKRIKLSFIDMNMDWCSDYICFNCTIIEIRDGEENSSHSLVRYCTAHSDYPVPKPITSTTRHVHVTFRVPMGDENRAKAKFEAHYQAVSDPTDFLLFILSIVVCTFLVIILVTSLTFIAFRHRRRHPSISTSSPPSQGALIHIEGGAYLVRDPEGPLQSYPAVYTLRPYPGPPFYITEGPSPVEDHEPSSHYTWDTERKT